MAKKKLNELFDEIRQENLKEDFEIGQAALALRELQKSAAAFSQYLNGPFTEVFKAIHNDPRELEGKLHELVKQLEAQKDKIGAVTDEMVSYLYDYESENNPEQDFRDLNRQNQDRRRTRDNRWSRWER